MSYINPQTYLDKILTERYARDMRQAIYDALSTINSNSHEAYTAATNMDPVSNAGIVEYIKNPIAFSRIFQGMPYLETGPIAQTTVVERDCELFGGFEYCMSIDTYYFNSNPETIMTIKLVSTDGQNNYPIATINTNGIKNFKFVPLKDCNKIFIEMNSTNQYYRDINNFKIEIKSTAFMYDSAWIEQKRVSNKSTLAELSDLNDEKVIYYFTAPEGSELSEIFGTDILCELRNIVANYGFNYQIITVIGSQRKFIRYYDKGNQQWSSLYSSDEASIKYTERDPQSILDEAPDSNYGYIRAVRIENNSNIRLSTLGSTMSLSKGDTILLYTTPPVTNDPEDPLYDITPIFQYGIILSPYSFRNLLPGGPHIIYRRWNRRTSSWVDWTERKFSTYELSDFNDSRDLEIKGYSCEQYSRERQIPNVEAVLNAIGGHTFKSGYIEKTEAWDTVGQNLYHIEGSYQLIGDYCILTATVDKIPDWYDAYYSIPVAWTDQAAAIAANDDNYIINTATEKNNHTVIRVSKVSTIGDRAMTGGKLYFTLVYKYQ